MRALTQNLKQAGIESDLVLEAMEAVPRSEFVPEDLRPYAYEDEAMPIDCGQTISQPFVVARMTELITNNVNLNSVLEIGTGSGYQAAILSKLFKAVYTMERIELLLEDACERFKKLGCTNIQTKYADGAEGWAEHAPFDAIIVTAAAPEIPSPLLAQLADGGRMIIPVGMPNVGQRLQLIQRHGEEYDIDVLDPVVFVPLLSGKD
ncbi:MAG: protein-L-isoaspartate(D-aspartate) O-methyltransferase [Coxiellaceae bacterium]|nr:protein-L-isoaspartate(D-aspartate) O-methyltransferase [Coxiellaceae bacterium]